MCKDILQQKDNMVNLFYLKNAIFFHLLLKFAPMGLVPNVKLDSNNRRIFDDHDIAWIQSLSCLKNCGMTLSEMKEYVNLCLSGESTIPERKIILDAKRKL